jgi:hypothetical protein
MFVDRLTAVIVEPAGIVAAMSNANTPAAKFTHAVLTGEEVKTSAVAVIAFSRIVLV